MTTTTCRTTNNRTRRGRRSRARILAEIIFELAIIACVIYTIISAGKWLVSAISHPNPPVVTADHVSSVELYTKIDKDIEEATTETSNSVCSNVYDSFSESDVKLFAALIEAEGGCAPQITKERIGIAFLNRINSELYCHDTVYELAYEDGQYETVMKGMLPDEPTAENMELATQIMGAFVSENWEQYCLDRKLSTKVVFQANSSIDQSAYSYSTLDEYGKVGEFSYHMIYGESRYDYSDVPHSEDRVGDYI